VIQPVPVASLVPLKKLTSLIQDEKRKAILGKPSRWPNSLGHEFSALERLSADSAYGALDLEYLRDESLRNRSFGYVIAYETFLMPQRDGSGQPVGLPELVAAVKLGDGGREDGYSAGKASGSIISRIVRSYWEDENVYCAELQGVVMPGADTAISNKVAKRLGGWQLRLRGDVWRRELLDHLSVEELLDMLYRPK
jgi:hypothetical protein